MFIGKPFQTWKIIAIQTALRETHDDSWGIEITFMADGYVLGFQ